MAKWDKLLDLPNNRPPEGHVAWYLKLFGWLVMALGLCLCFVCVILFVAIAILAVQEQHFFATGILCVLMLLGVYAGWKILNVGEQWARPNQKQLAAQSRVAQAFQANHGQGQTVQTVKTSDAKNLLHQFKTFEQPEKGGSVSSSLGQLDVPVREHTQGQTIGVATVPPVSPNKETATMQTAPSAQQKSLAQANRPPEGNFIALVWWVMMSVVWFMLLLFFVALTIMMAAESAVLGVVMGALMCLAVYYLSAVCKRCARAYRAYDAVQQPWSSGGLKS